MHSYRFPLPRAHGPLVAFLLQFGRKVGLVAAAAVDDRTNRRHRMMLAVDERCAYARVRRHHIPGLIPPAIAAVSRPTYFGSFCSSLVAWRVRPHEQPAKREAAQPGRGMESGNRRPSINRQVSL